jgi:hypothetical protein
VGWSSFNIVLRIDVRITTAPWNSSPGAYNALRRIVGLYLLNLRMISLLISNVPKVVQIFNHFRVHDTSAFFLAIIKKPLAGFNYQLPQSLTFRKTTYQIIKYQLASSLKLGAGLV